MIILAINRFVLLVNFRNLFDKALMEIFQFRRALLDIMDGLRFDYKSKLINSMGFLGKKILICSPDDKLLATPMVCANFEHL